MLLQNHHAEQSEMGPITKERLIWILSPGFALSIFAAVGQFALRILRLGPEFLVTPFEAPLFWLIHLMRPNDGWTYHAPYPVDHPFEWLQKLLSFGQIALVWFCIGACVGEAARVGFLWLRSAARSK